jgi:fimbrial isopeptide formation D2 family protein/LPXTG-motif cell wall-anchored protein
MKTRTKWGAAVSSALLAATLFPAAGLAQTSTADVADTTATLTGLTAGDTVTAYQVFDADINANNELTYTAATGLPEAYDTTDELSAMKSGSSEAKAATDAYVAAFAGGTATAANGHTATATADASGNAKLTLDSGYWVAVVTTTSGTSKVFQPMAIDASPKIVDGKYAAQTISDQSVKNTPVDFTKGIGDNLAESTDAYTVGQSVPFTVKTNVPNYPTNSTNATFKITDTPSAGLSIDTSTIKVTVGTDTVWQNGAAVNAAAFNTATTTTAESGYTFDFAKDFVLAHPGQQVAITYNAKITSAALADAAKGTTGNTAKLTFNPNPYATGTAEPGDNTKLQTYGFVFHKTDKDGKALEGATFTLYDANGTNMVTDENGRAITSTSTTVNGVAYVYFDHLGHGTYTAKETTVPAGKQKALDVTFTVGADTATGDNPATIDVTETNYQVKDENVIDPDQPLLPVTGDAGTFLLTLGGVVLVSASVALYARSRKKER